MHDGAALVYMFFVYVVTALRGIEDEDEYVACSKPGKSHVNILFYNICACKIHRAHIMNEIA